MRLAVCYMVVMATLGATPTGGKLTSCQDNGMTPEAPFVFVGETLRLCCNVTRACRDVTAPSDVMFFAKDEAVREAEIGFQPGSRSVVCMAYAVEHTPFKLKKYYCKVFVPSTPPSPPQHRPHQQEQQQCLGYQIVRTDYSPKRLMEKLQVECVVEGLNLSCEFADVKQRFNVPERSTLSVHFSSRGPGTQGACDVTCRQGTCSTTMWQGTDFYLPEIVSFNITLTYTVTDAGTWNDNHTCHVTNITRSGTHHFQITPSERVRVPPPSQLSVTSLNASCLHVTWRLVRSEWLHWRLVLVSPRNNSTIKEEEFEGKNLTSYRLCDPDLFPFTLYNVRLSCRRESSQVWSHVTATSVRTPMAPPDGSPDLATGYSLRGEHEAVFYWKPVSANGPELHYQMNITTARQQRTVTTNVTHASVRVDALDLEAGSEVHVQAENAAGGGTAVSVIRLAPGLDEGPELLAIVEKEKADFVTLNITWPAASSSFIDSYTVFWCTHSSRAPGDCKDAVAWQSVPANTTWYSLAVNSSAWPVTYGVSTQYSVGDSILTTGFRFSACFFTRDNAGALQAVYSQDCNGKMLPVSYFREPQYVAAAFVVVGCLAGIACCALVVTGARAVSARFRQAEQKFAKNITHRAETDAVLQKKRVVPAVRFPVCHEDQCVVTALMVSREVSDLSHSTGYSTQHENGADRDHQADIVNGALGRDVCATFLHLNSAATDNDTDTCNPTNVSCINRLSPDTDPQPMKDLESDSDSNAESSSSVVAASERWEASACCVSTQHRYGPWGALGESETHERYAPGPEAYLPADDVSLSGTASPLSQGSDWSDGDEEASNTCGQNTSLLSSACPDRYTSWASPAANNSLPVDNYSDNSLSGYDGTIRRSNDLETKGRGQGVPLDNTGSQKYWTVTLK